MPRPRPIIIPGQTGFGGDFTQTQVDLNLPGILQLYDATIGRRKREAADIEAVRQLAPMLGIPEELPVPAGEPTELPTGGMVNIPGQPPPQPARDVAASPGGRKFVFDALTKIASRQAGTSGTMFEVNNQYDAFLASSQSVHGQDLNTPVGYAQAVKWWSTPAGQQAWNDFQTQQAREQFVGMGPGGTGVVFNQKTGDFRLETIPGGAPGPKRLGRLSAERTQELADMRTTYERLGIVGRKAEKLKGKFGPVEGRWNNLHVRWQEDGPTQGLINELRSLITIAYSLSGKQISVDEMKMLEAAMLPRLEQPYENFKATLEFARSWVARTYNNRITGFKDSGFDVKRHKMIPGISEISPQGRRPLTTFEGQ